MKIGIIGAGIAGLSFAKAIRSYATHAEITLVDKSRGVGGRMANRRTPTHQFSHGAQFFTARSKPFQKFLERYIADGTVEEWKARITTLEPGKKPFGRPWFEPHYVASPSMTSLAKAMATEFEVRLGHEIVEAHRSSDGWRILAQGHPECGPFDWLVCTAPLQQAAQLFPQLPRPDSVQYEPCFALMLPFRDEVGLPAFDAAVVRSSPIEWIAFSHRTPAGASNPGLVAHTGGTWSTANLERPLEELEEELVAEVHALLGSQPRSEEPMLHRWRYSKVVQPCGNAFWIDPSIGLAACGDWCLGGRVEDAFTSADRLAAAFAAQTLPGPA